MKFKIIIFSLLLFSRAIFSYPQHWWEPIPEDQRFYWEILPQEASRSKKEVILSKRNELGSFSNFANTPFEMHGILYQSVEGLWQSMKFPDSHMINDPRFRIKGWKHTREEVQNLSSFEAKHAGNHASQLMKQNHISWVSFEGQKILYKDHLIGSQKHYKIIYKAIKNKIKQNPQLIELLNKTKGLKLRPDHKVHWLLPKSFHYYKILMKIRSELKN